MLYYKGCFEFDCESHMQNRNEFDSKLARIFEATGAKNDTALARILQIRPASVAGARKRQLIPGVWIEKIARDYKINANWLFFGVGPVYVGDAGRQEKKTAMPDCTADSPRVAFTEGPIEHLATANERLWQMMERERELVAHERELQKEISELKARNAALEEKLDVLEPSPRNSIYKYNR